MATKTIGTSGRQYSSGSAWIVYLNALGAFTEAEIGEVYNDGLLTESKLNFTAVNNGAHQLTMRAATGEGFAGHASALTNNLYPKQANGVLFVLTGSGRPVEVDLDNFLMEGLQAVITNWYAQSFYFYKTAASNLWVKKCILLRESSNGTSSCFQGRGWRIEDSVLISKGPDDPGILAQYQLNYVYNSTIVHNGAVSTASAINSAGGGTVNLYNCAVFGFSAWGSAASGGDYNASDMTGGPGANDIPGLTYVNQFEDITTSYTWAETDVTDFRALSTSGLAGEANPATATLLDILGQTRSLTAPYIGAHEILAAGGLDLVKVIDEVENALEATVTSQVLLRLLNETVATGETVISVRAILRLINEASDISEALDKALGLVREINEFVQPSEALDAILGIVKVINENASISEALLTILGIVQIVEETGQVSESVIGLQKLVRLIANDIQTTEGTLKFLSIVRVVAEALSVSETALSTRKAVVLVNEMILSLEALNKALGIVKEVSETASITENTDVALGLVREVIESVGISESVEFLKTLVQLIDETTQLTELPVHVRALVQLLNETAQLADEAVTSQEKVRVFSHILTVADDVEATLALLRVVNETLEVQEGNIFSRALTIVFNETISITDSVFSTTDVAVLEAFTALMASVQQISNFFGGKDAEVDLNASSDQEANLEGSND